MKKHKYRAVQSYENYINNRHAGIVTGVKLRLSERQKKQAGFNAIELSLVLAVIAIAVVATIRIMGGNTDKQNATQMVNDVSTIVSNVKNLYSSSTNGYNSLNTTIAIDAKVVPQDLKIPNGGGTIQNQFQGGTVDIIAANNGEAFQITYTNVPSAICNSAINTLGGAGFLTITINGTTVYDANAGTSLDAANVASSCKQGAEKSSIVFTAS